MADRRRWSPEGSNQRRKDHPPAEYQQPPGMRSTEYLSSSSSSSYLDISRRFSGYGIRAFFTAPSERRKLRKRRSSRILKLSNSSSSSINSDLAYGTGYLRRPKSRNVRSRKGKDIDRERQRDYNRDRIDREYTKEKILEKERFGSERRATTDAEIIAVGAGLMKIARDQNKRDQRDARNGKRPEIVNQSSNYGGASYSRGLGPSKVSHGDDEDDGWESASDAGSESTVDSKLAFTEEPSSGWFGFGKNKYKPQSRKSTVVDPAQFGPSNSLYGIITEPVGLGSVPAWTSSSDFGQQGPIQYGTGESVLPYYGPRVGPPEDPTRTSNIPYYNSRGPASAGTSNSITNISNVSYNDQRRSATAASQYEDRRAAPVAPQYEARRTASTAFQNDERRSAPVAPPESSTSSFSQQPLQHVYPMPTSDPSRFDVARNYAATGAESYVSSRARPDPVPIQQPQPFTPVSQSVYEPSYIAHSEPSISKKSLSSSGRSKSLAEAALVGVAGAALGASIVSNRSDDRKEKHRDDRDRGETKIKDDKEERRREKDREERRDRRRKEDKKESGDDQYREKRERRREGERDDGKSERREKRREDKRSDRSETVRSERSDSYTSRRTKSEASVHQTPVDPFQFQVSDDAFATPNIPSTPNHGRIASVPTIYTVEREPAFAGNESSSVKAQSTTSRPDSRREETEWNPREQSYRRKDSPERPLHNAEAIYQETKHSTAPIEAAAIGAAIAAITTEEYRESRSDRERRREERRGRNRSRSQDRPHSRERERNREPNVYESFSPKIDLVMEEPPRQRDPIQEEADRAYREIVMARKIASQVIRSRSPSPEPSVMNKYDHDNQEKEIIRIVTPPGMEDRKKEGPYDAPNADFKLDYVLEHPRDLQTFNIPSINSRGSDFSYLKRDPDASLPRPHLNLVRPTPTPSPLPEKQEARSDPVKPTVQTTNSDAPNVIIDARGNVVSSPTSSTVSKAVTWGENDIKHYEIESPHEERKEFVSSPEIQAQEPSYSDEPKTAPKSSTNRNWGAAIAGITGAATTASSSDISNKRSKNIVEDSRFQDSRDAPYEYRGVVVEPESPKSPERRSPPTTGPKPTSPQRPHIPGTFDDDLDLAATTPTGLQDTAPASNIVIDDALSHRFESLPDPSQPGMYQAPFAETVSDLGFMSAGGSLVNSTEGFVIGEVPETPQDWRSVSPDNGETLTRLSKKDQKKRDKALKRQSVDTTPMIEETPISKNIVEDYFEVPKLSKKEQKKRDKAAGRSGSQADDVAPFDEPSVTQEIVEEPESYFETPKKSKKKSKRGSSLFEEEIEDNNSKKSKSRSSAFNEGLDESARNAEKIVSVPVDAFIDLQIGEDEWNEPKKSKKKSKRDSERFDSPARSVTSEIASPQEKPSSKKSKDKSRKSSEMYEPEATEVSLPPSTPSETSRDGEIDEFRKSRKSSKRDSGERDDSRSVVSSIVSAGASRYADDDYKKPKKKSRSSTRDDFDDTRSVASAPAGDEFDDVKKNKKKDKRSSGGFFGLFGSKSETARDDSPKGVRDEFEEISKRSKRSKRSSTGADSTGLYGSTESHLDLSLTSSNGNANGNGHNNGAHVYDEVEGERPRHADDTEKPRSRAGSTSSKKDSFLAKADTLGAGVGLAGAAVAIAAQHHRQQSKADKNESEERTELVHSIDSQQQYDLIDPEIAERQIRPSIDPQYGDLLPLPPSDPASPNVEPVDNLPQLPESRPDTPEIDRTPRERTTSSVRRSMQDSPMKSPSQSAVPLKFMMGNRSTPPSPAFPRPSPLQSPVTPRQASLVSPRDRARPKSWDSTKEYKPLYLVESNRRPSFQQDKLDEHLPSLPLSETTSRSTSELDFQDALEQPHWQEPYQPKEALSIETSLQPSHDLPDSQQSTPRGPGFPRDAKHPFDAVVEALPDDSSYPREYTDPLISSYMQRDEPELPQHSDVVAAAFLTSAVGIVAASSKHSLTQEEKHEHRLVSSFTQRSPSRVKSFSKDRSSPHLQSSPTSGEYGDVKNRLDSPVDNQEARFPDVDPLHSTEKNNEISAAGSTKDTDNGSINVAATPSEYLSMPAAASLQIEDKQFASLLEEDPVDLLTSISEHVDLEPLEEFSVTKSKKDKKKDKKNGKGNARTLTWDDIPETEPTRELPQESPITSEGLISENHNTIIDTSSLDDKTDAPLVWPLVEDAEQVDDFVSATSKKDKKKKKKSLRHSSNQESNQDDSSTPSATPSVPEAVGPELPLKLDRSDPTSEFADLVDDRTDPEEEHSSKKSRKEKRKKKGLSRSSTQDDFAAAQDSSADMKVLAGVDSAEELLATKPGKKSSRSVIQDENSALEALENTPENVSISITDLGTASLQDPFVSDEVPILEGMEEPQPVQDYSFLTTSKKEKKKKKASSRSTTLQDEVALPDAASMRQQDSSLSETIEPVEDFGLTKSKKDEKRDKKKGKSATNWGVEEETTDYLAPDSIDTEANEKLSIQDKSPVQEAFIGEELAGPATFQVEVVNSPNIQQPSPINSDDAVEELIATGRSAGPLVESSELNISQGSTLESDRSIEEATATKFPTSETVEPGDLSLESTHNSVKETLSSVQLVKSPSPQIEVPPLESSRGVVTEAIVREDYERSLFPLPQVSESPVYTISSSQDIDETFLVGSSEPAPSQHPLLEYQEPHNISSDTVRGIVDGASGDFETMIMKLKHESEEFSDKTVEKSIISEDAVESESQGTFFTPENKKGKKQKKGKSAATSGPLENEQAILAPATEISDESSVRDLEDLTISKDIGVEPESQDGFVSFDTKKSKKQKKNSKSTATWDPTKTVEHMPILSPSGSDNLVEFELHDSKKSKKKNKKSQTWTPLDEASSSETNSEAPNNLEHTLIPEVASSVPIEEPFFSLPSSKKSKRKSKLSQAWTPDPEPEVESLAKKEATIPSTPTMIEDAGEYSDVFATPMSEMSKDQEIEVLNFEPESIEETTVSSENALSTPDSSSVYATPIGATPWTAVGGEPLAATRDYFPSSTTIHSSLARQVPHDSRDKGYFPSAPHVVQLAAIGAAVLGSELDKKEAPIQDKDTAVGTVTKQASAEEPTEFSSGQELGTPPTPDGLTAVYDSKQLDLARQLQQEFGSGNKNSKKDKKKRQSLPTTPNSDHPRSRSVTALADTHARSRSLSIGPLSATETKEDTPTRNERKSMYSEEQLELARQLKADFEFGKDANKMSKKDREMRQNVFSESSTYGDLSPTQSTQTIDSECADLGPNADLVEEKATPDGFAAGYQEDQLSLARQLQAEFGSGSKKSRKDKKSRSTSRTPNKEELNDDFSGVAAHEQPQLNDQLDAIATSSNSGMVDSEIPARYGLAAGYNEDQVELARQLKEEFGSGPKRSKKDKKRQSLLRSTTDDHSTYDVAPKDLQGLANIQTSTMETESTKQVPENAEDDFNFIPKKFKQDKKSKKRDSLATTLPDENVPENIAADEKPEGVDFDPSSEPTSGFPDDEFAAVSKKSKKDKKGRKRESLAVTVHNEMTVETSANDELKSADLMALLDPDTAEPEQEFLFTPKKSKKDKKRNKRESLADDVQEDVNPTKLHVDDEPQVADFDIPFEPVNTEPDEFLTLAKESEEKKGEILESLAPVSFEDVDPSDMPGLNEPEDTGFRAKPTSTEPERVFLATKKSKKDKKSKKRDSIKYNADEVSVSSDVLEQILDAPPSADTTENVESTMSSLEDESTTTKKSKKDKKGKKHESLLRGTTDDNIESGSLVEEVSSDQQAPIPEESSQEIAAKDSLTTVPANGPSEHSPKFIAASDGTSDLLEKNDGLVEPLSREVASLPNASTVAVEDPEPETFNDWAVTTKKSKKDKTNRGSLIQSPSEDQSTDMEAKPLWQIIQDVSEVRPSPPASTIDGQDATFKLTTKKSKKDRRNKQQTLQLGTAEDVSLAADEGNDVQSDPNADHGSYIVVPDSIDSNSDATPTRDSVSQDPEDGIIDVPGDDMSGNSAFTSKKSKKHKKRKDSSMSNLEGNYDISTPTDPIFVSSQSIEPSLPLSQDQEKFSVIEPGPITSSDDIITVEPATVQIEGQPEEELANIPSKKSNKDKKSKYGTSTTPLEALQVILSESSNVDGEVPSNSTIESSTTKIGNPESAALIPKEGVEKPEEEWGSHSLKKSKKAKKQRESGLSTPADVEPFPESITPEVVVQPTETFKEPDTTLPIADSESTMTALNENVNQSGEWGERSSKKSKKDKKKHNSGLFAPAELDLVVPKDAIEVVTSTNDFQDPDPVTLVSKGDVEQHEEEWGAFSTKKSKKDKKKRKSEPPTPAELEPVVDATDIDKIAPATNLVLEDYVSLKDLENPQPITLVSKQDIEQPQDEWDKIPAKKSKKDKKKQKSGFSTPAETLPPIFEPDSVKLEQQPEPVEPLLDKDLEFMATIAAGLKDTGFDPDLVMDNPSFRSSTSRDTSFVQSKQTEPTADNNLNFMATVAACLQDTGFDPNIIIDDPSFRSSPSREIDANSQQPDEEWGNYSLKKSKKDKKRQKAGISVATEQLLTEVESHPGTKEQLERNLEAPTHGDLPPVETTHESLIQEAQIVLEDDSEAYAQLSKKGKKKRKSGVSTPVQDSLPVENVPVTSDVATNNPITPQNDLLDDSFYEEANSNTIPIDASGLMDDEVVDTQANFSLGRKLSKKDKRKRQNRVDSTMSTIPGSGQAPLTSWADEVEEAEVERRDPVIEDIASDKSLSIIPSTTEVPPVDEFIRPSKKGKKGKRGDSTPVEPSSSVSTSVLIGAGAAAAIVSKTPEAPAKKMSKKEKRKISIDKRAPKDDMFDDPALWEGAEPQVFEEADGAADQNDNDSDGFWELPRDDNRDDIVDETLELDDLTRQRSADEEHTTITAELPPPSTHSPKANKQSFSDDTTNYVESGIIDGGRPTNTPVTEQQSNDVTEQFTAASSKKDKKKEQNRMWEAPQELSKSIPDDAPKEVAISKLESENDYIEPPQGRGFSFDSLPTENQEFISTAKDINDNPRFGDAPHQATRSIGQELFTQPSAFSYPGPSSLPVVREESQSPKPLDDERYAPSANDYVIADYNRDSAFISGSPIPPAGFADEHIRDSGVHFRDFSPAEKTRLPAASTDDALARLSWPSVDEETETVDIDKFQRTRDVADLQHHDITPLEPVVTSYEAQTPQDYSDRMQAITSPHTRRERSQSPLSAWDEKTSSRERRPSPLSTSTRHGDNSVAEFQRGQNETIDSRGTLPSQRHKQEHLSSLHRTQTIHKSPKPQGDSLVKQRIQRIESPEPARSQTSKADKYADLHPSQRPKAEKTMGFSENSVTAGAAIVGASVGFAAARQSSREQRPGSVDSNRSPSNIYRLRTPDPKLHRPESVGSNRSSGTPPLRRSDRKSGDLRSLSQQSKSDLAKEAELAALTASAVSAASITNPTANEGRVRAKDMADVYDGFGEGHLGSPRSPTRPHSMRRRQSMQVLDLESRLEQLAAENRLLAEAKAQADHTLQNSQNASSALVERDMEIDGLKRTLDWLQNEVTRLSEVNDGLTSANVTLGNQQNDRYGQLETKYAQTARELQEMRDAHNNLSGGMEGIVTNEVQNAVQEKDQEIAQLRAELEAAKEQIRGMQRQILAAKASESDFLTIRDEDYFDTACQQLCQHVQQWVLRFSKFSDMRACRLTSEINNDKIIDRLDNAILDGSDVDNYLADRVKRRDVFMSMTMTMVWEFIFTRYLFGMDREQRQKLKSLEKQLLEVGPPSAVHQWRATTLTLLSKREVFAEQRKQDTIAVVNAIMETLTEILPPPSHLEEQIQEQLSRVMKAAVDLSIEMRTQRAEYMMLPPLQPEYDANGDLASKVSFNAALMNERSGESVSNEELEEQGATVRIVLFPLVVKKGNDSGDGDEEIVVCPAQVLVAKTKKTRVFSGGSVQNHSKVSMQSTMPAEHGEI